MSRAGYPDIARDAADHRQPTAGPNTSSQPPDAGRGAARRRQAPGTCRGAAKGAREAQTSAPPPKVISIGGREGLGQRINGDYELLDGEKLNGRPCWLRRSQLYYMSMAAGEPTEASLEDGSQAESQREADTRPLYLFFSEMGYWTIAPSLHASGVHVYARNGPDFSVRTPDAVIGPWVIFWRGKARPDPCVTCFQSDALHEPSSILHLSGCKGAYGQLNGIYRLMKGGSGVSTRPIYIKDGISGAKDKKMQLIHFSQRAGRWLVSSAIAVSRGKDGSTSEAGATSGVAGANSADAAAGVGEQPTDVEWKDVRILATSPVAWYSMSPIHLMPREHWQVRSDLDMSKIGVNAKLHRDTESDFFGEPGARFPTSFVPYADLRVSGWNGESRNEESCASLAWESASDANQPQTSAASLPQASLSSTSAALNPQMLCIYLRSPQGLSDPYLINGDYIRSSDTYHDRPVFIKLPLCGKPPSRGSWEGKLCLFFDDMSGRWQISPEMGSLVDGVARSLVNWDSLWPPLEEVWQLRVPPAVASLSAELGLRTDPPPAPVFREWADFQLTGIANCVLPRTVVLGFGSVAEPLEMHTLSGDFRLSTERYGSRPIYRRLPQISGGSPQLFLFFEPRSGYWTISSQSPLSVGPSTPIGDPGIFGEVYARSGPAWEPFCPQDAAAWEVFDMESLRPEELLEYRGRAPDSVLSPLFAPTPSLRAHALHPEAAPRWLAVGGFPSRTKTVCGTYELLDEVHWSSRPAWQKVAERPRAGRQGCEFTKFLYFWSETGHWILGPELHSPLTALARVGPGWWGAESPDEHTGTWDVLSGKTFQPEPQVYIRKLKSAAGGFDIRSPSPSVSRLTSPRGLVNAPSSPRSNTSQSSAPVSPRSGAHSPKRTAPRTVLGTCHEEPVPPKTSNGNVTGGTAVELASLEALRASAEARAAELASLSDDKKIASGASSARLGSSGSRSGGPQSRRQDQSPRGGSTSGISRLLTPTVASTLRQRSPSPLAKEKSQRASPAQPPRVPAAKSFVKWRAPSPDRSPSPAQRGAAG